MKKRFQVVYIISKFKKVQAKFMGTVYYDLISTLERCFVTIYEVQEDIVCINQHEMKTFFVSFQRDKCELPLVRVLRNYLQA